MVLVSQLPIIGIELAPGDEPRAVEQLNGDLLLPAQGRPVVEHALPMAEEALPEECREELRALATARRLLGIVKVDHEQERKAAQLLTVREI